MLKLITLAAVCISIASGCFQLPEQGHDFNVSNVEKIKVGETTEPQVVELIGKPDHRTRNADGSAVLMYQHLYANKGQMSIFGPVKGNEYSMKTLTVMIGSNGKVTNYTQGGE
jgi:outer membrane protein assembly factor BamE (lipoprotein component of BamABCDE complex)